jgi:hypothetical protein
LFSINLGVITKRRDVTWSITAKAIHTGGEGNQLMETRISRSTKEVIISDDNPTVLIGERINPADKKQLLEALNAKRLEVKLDNPS